MKEGLKSPSRAHEWITDQEAVRQAIPLTRLFPKYVGAYVDVTFESQLGGFYKAIYECRAIVEGGYLAHLIDVYCVIPPCPPQLRGFDDTVRIPMPTMEEEIKQRCREWRAC